MIVLILEDEEIQADYLKSNILKCKEDWIIYVANTYEQALQLSNEYAIELFFLDIGLGKSESKTGITFAMEIRSILRYKNTPIIYITAFPDEVYDVINYVHCFSYIIKPYSADDIRKVINDYINNKETIIDSIPIKDKHRINIMFHFDDIVFIKSCTHTCQVFTTNNELTTVHQSLTSILKQLDKNFIRIHKTRIMNIKYVKSYDKSSLLLHTEYGTFEVGRKYKHNVESLFS